VANFALLPHAVEPAMHAHLRVARPVSSLERSVALYRDGLGLVEIGRFEDHEGFDGVMLGRPGLDYHFEFTCCRAHPVRPAPTPEDLTVFYLPDPTDWEATCANVLAAGFVEVESFNPYWGRQGRTFTDPDGYRVVLQQARWAAGGRSAAPSAATLAGLAACVLAFGLATLAFAAPDEEKLGKSQGYPVAKIGNNKDWYYDESVRVGSFTHQAEIPGLNNGKFNTLERSAHPLALPKVATEPAYRWSIDRERDLTVDDFLARQRIMGLLVIKDGVIQVERYQYDRKPADRFTSNSMAKSIASLAIGYALAEGKIASLDDRADRYAAKLKGTVFGETTIRNLLRMASGIRYRQAYVKGEGDTTKFSIAINREGVEAAAGYVRERENEQGSKFYYASANSVMLGAIVRGATGMSVSEYLTPRLWQAIGAANTALWRTDRTGLEIVLGNFNATLRDYGRLGVVLANDGVRPDDPALRQIIPRQYLLDATDWHRADEPFRPGKATPFWGYGYQFWLYPGAKRRFALLGVYGQSIFVDPAAKLVIVQTAANATAEAGDNSLARERDAFWRGVTKFYGP
jgi:CubicO group peptidase (beta-lactamase class C family)